jgi:AraC-like DNA-binding protein
MRSGRPRTVGDEAVAELISKTLARKPKAATHWSVRAIAKETGITKSTVHRLFQLFGLQPHRTRSFKLSTDPFFVEKLRDVVGLYLNPPDKTVVLCVDEKSQIRPSNAPSPCFRLVKRRHACRLERSDHDIVAMGRPSLRSPQRASPKPGRPCGERRSR